MRSALQLCVVRLRKDKEIVEEERLFWEIDAAIAVFGQIDYEGEQRLKDPMTCRNA